MFTIDVGASQGPLTAISSVRHKIHDQTEADCIPALPVARLVLRTVKHTQKVLLLDGRVPGTQVNRLTLYPGGTRRIIVVLQRSDLQ